MSVTINGSGQVPVQVISTTKTDSFTTSSTSLVDVTGLSVTITPSSASNKIMVFCDLSVGCASSAYAMFQLVRNATEIYKGTEAKTYVASHIVYPYSESSQEGYALIPATLMFVDSPATTSAVTYKIQARATANTLGINRRALLDDTSLASSITVMEISG